MKFLHTMIRVRDLDRSVAFYRDVLGMKELSRKEYPAGEFTLVFLGYGDSKYDPCVELTYNWGKTDYEMGNAFGHIALEFPDIYAACDRIREKGGEVTREPGPMKHGTTELAFVRDPDGYQIELIQTKK